MFCSCNLSSFCLCSPAGVWTVTTVTQSWALEVTVVPACAPMGRAADATFLTAATLWLTSWCVFAALVTKVHTRMHQKLSPCTGLFRSGVTCCSSRLSNYHTQPECALSVLAVCRRQV